VATAVSTVITYVRQRIDAIARRWRDSYLAAQEAPL